MMYTELIRNLDDDLLLELHKNLIEILKSERKTWLDDETTRTHHFESLIRDTREELEFVQLHLRFRKLKEIK